MNKFTPGPWMAICQGVPTTYNGRTFWLTDPIYEAAEDVGDREPKKIAEICYPHIDRPDLNPVTPEEAKANAHLIAAAPDMYEALVALQDAAISVRFSDMPEGLWESIINAKKVISKARGES